LRQEPFYHTGKPLALPILGQQASHQSASHAVSPVEPGKFKQAYNRQSQCCPSTFNLLFPYSAQQTPALSVSPHLAQSRQIRCCKQLHSLLYRTWCQVDFLTYHNPICLMVPIRMRLLFQAYLQAPELLSCQRLLPKLKQA